MVKDKVRPIEIVEDLDDTEELTDSPYRVILHNDNTTPIPFVAFILLEVFELNKDNAVRKIMEAESKGASTIMSGCGFEEANEKVSEADSICKKEGYELKFTIEEE